MVRNNKIAIVVKDCLKDWQKLNVVSFLASSVAIAFPETHGRAFVTASKSEYLPFLNQPVLIYVAESEKKIKRALQRAKAWALHIGLYTEPLFATNTDRDNLAAIAQFSDEEQALVGLVLYGDKKNVNKALEGLKFHP